MMKEENTCAILLTSGLELGNVPPILFPRFFAGVSRNFFKEIHLGLHHEIEEKYPKKIKSDKSED